MSKKTETHSSVLTALRFAERVLTNDSELPCERRRQVIGDLESICAALTQLWSDEFEYISSHVEDADQPNKLGNPVS